MALFPTLIHRTILEEFTPENTFYKKRALELKNTLPRNNDWQTDIFTTYGTSYDIFSDILFKRLIQACTLEVNKFAREFGTFDGSAQCIEGFINVGSRGHFQEYHIHPGSHFSLVYYVTAPENSGNIVFRSPTADNMMPPPKFKETYPAGYPTFFIPPIESGVLVFKSDLSHMVQKNNTDEDRISIAMNFIL